MGAFCIRAARPSYQLTDGRQIRAVIILRDGAVFIRRLYISTATGETQRAN